MNLRLRVFDRIRGRWYPEDPETGDLPMLLLVYLSFLLLPLTLPRFDVVSWVPTLVALALFLPLYFHAWWRSRHLFAEVLAMAGIGVVLTPVNPGASTFVVYALAHAAELRNTRQAYGVLFGTAVLYAGLLLWLSFPPIVLIAALVPGVAVFFANRGMREAQRKRAVLKLSQEEVQRLSQRAERERIARDLHDLLGHTLGVIALKAELARKLALRAPERAADEIAQVEQLARSGLEEVRLALHGMRRTTLDEECAQARLALEAGGVSLSLTREELPLDRDTEAVLAYALREAVTNVLRHARARSASIQLGGSASQVWLEVRDDGRGGALPSGHGLRGMQERVDAAGGRLRVDSPAAGGTLLRVELPQTRQTRPDAVVQLPHWLTQGSTS